MLTKRIIALILILFIFCFQSFAGSITKKTSLHHSVTELGNIQVRQVIEYVEDDGKIKEKKHGKPYTPKDPKAMDGFDDRSKEIVAVIISPEVKVAFEVEKQKKTGIGTEEIVTYDRVIEEDGKIAVRCITRIFDDGVEVSKKYHRSWIMPGDDPVSADVISKALATKLHTPKVIADHKAAELVRRTIK